VRVTLVAGHGATRFACHRVLESLNPLACIVTQKLNWWGSEFLLALFAWLISRTFSANEQYFSLTTNQPTILLAMTYQPSEQGKQKHQYKQKNTAAHVRRNIVFDLPTHMS